MRKPQNRKYITYRNGVRGGPTSHEHKKCHKHSAKIGRVVFELCGRTDGRTDKRTQYIEEITLCRKRAAVFTLVQNLKRQLVWAAAGAKRFCVADWTIYRNAVPNRTADAAATTNSWHYSKYGCRLVVLAGMQHVDALIIAVAELV